MRVYRRNLEKEIENLKAENESLKVENESLKSQNNNLNNKVTMQDSVLTLNRRDEQTLEQLEEFLDNLPGILPRYTEGSTWERVRRAPAVRLAVWLLGNHNKSANTEDAERAT